MFDKIGAIGTRSSYFMEQISEDASFKNAKPLNPSIISQEISKFDNVLDNIEKNNRNFKNRIKEWKR